MIFFSRNFIGTFYWTFAVFYKSLHVCVHTHNVSTTLPNVYENISILCVSPFIRVTGQPWNTWLFFYRSYQRCSKYICFEILIDHRNWVGICSNDSSKLDSNIKLVMFILHCIKFKWSKVYTCSTSKDKGQWIVTELGAFVWQQNQWTTNIIEENTYTCKYVQKRASERVREWYVRARDSISYGAPQIRLTEATRI